MDTPLPLQMLTRMQLELHGELSLWGNSPEFKSLLSHQTQWVSLGQLLSAQLTTEIC